MRFWIPSEAERKPNPAPARPDERIPILIGVVVWLVAFAALAVFALPLLQARGGVVFWTIVCGLGIGLLGIGYTWRRARRAAAAEHEGPRASGPTA